MFLSLLFRQVLVAGTASTLFVGAAAGAVPLTANGIKWQSDYMPQTPKWYFAADNSAVDFIDKINNAPVYSDGIYYGHDGLLDHNATHIKLVDGLLYSFDEHGPDSELVSSVNKHLSASPGFNVDITAPKILAALTGVLVLAGIACALIPACLPFIATNLGTAIKVFKVAAGGQVVGVSGGVVAALSSVAPAIGLSDIEFDTSREGFLGIGGYHISTELYDHMHDTVSKRRFEDESFACIYTDGWVGTCHNEATLKPILSQMANHDKNDKDNGLAGRVEIVLMAHYLAGITIASARTTTVNSHVPMGHQFRHGSVRNTITREASRFQKHVGPKLGWLTLYPLFVWPRVWSTKLLKRRGWSSRSSKSVRLTVTGIHGALYANIQYLSLHIYYLN